MRKRILALVLAWAAVILCACGPDKPPETAPDLTTPVETTPPATTEFTAGSYTAVNYENMKAIWLSQYDLSPIYLSGDTQRPEADFTARMAQVLDNVASSGFNTVFLQIRPNADSMYPSAFYPTSAYVTGGLGTPTEYDPVAIIVELAHGRNLSIHAWINPLRGMDEADIALVDSRYPIRRWYDSAQVRGKYLVAVDGKWYLNPAYSAVGDLIVAGAQEALDRYAFDGLHMDDYFYPTTDPGFDKPAYDAFGGSRSLGDFRRENINLLVRRLYDMTHATGTGRIFGISPAGNYETVYARQYADIYTWCAQAGYVDYICPQVYFGLEHGSFDFQKVCRVYSDMIQTESVDLIVGMTFGKAFSGEDPWAGTGKNEWQAHKDVLARSLQTTRSLPHCRGISVFCYQYIFDPLSGAPIPETAREWQNFCPILKGITWE